MSDFSIVADSSCDLPPEYIRKHGIEILPMPYDLDGQSHDLGYWQEITPEKYYAALRGGSVAKTTLINFNLFMTAFTRLAEQGRDALFFILSSGLSSTFQNAEMALREVKEKYPDSNIYVIDSINASIGHGMLVRLAVKKREEGLSAGESADWIEKKKHQCFAFFSVDDLMYLHRGGRLSKLSAVAGSALNLKPILNIAPDGSLALKDKVRGRKMALKHLVSQIERSMDSGGSLGPIFITHTDCEEDAQTLALMIKETLGMLEIEIMMLGPIIGAHLGPGAIAVTCEAAMTREVFEKKFYNKK
ncbi:MAG: DegV family protein [Peptococcaceae bacterium]|nr:DegV family protein [Peptococcaceae bacterium]